MAYCTQQNLIDRYGEIELIQLSDHDGVGEIDTDVLDRAISDAEGEIDGHLGGRFQLPISPLPKSLQRIACDIARYYLYDDNATEQVTKRYNDAVKFLQGVAKGTINIGIASSGDKPSSQNTATVISGGSVFNRKDNSFI
ncbi:MAG: DUF1320 domain-containing protein [Candidatus Sedimenticola sp. (ex Thyasira tokunagai)]